MIAIDIAWNKTYYDSLAERSRSGMRAAVNPLDLPDPSSQTFFPRLMTRAESMRPVCDACDENFEEGETPVLVDLVVRVDQVHEGCAEVHREEMNVYDEDAEDRDR